MVHYLSTCNALNGNVIKEKIPFGSVRCHPSIAATTTVMEATPAALTQYFSIIEQIGVKLSLPIFEHKGKQIFGERVRAVCVPQRQRT